MSIGGGSSKSGLEASGLGTQMEFGGSDSPLGQLAAQAGFGGGSNTSSSSGTGGVTPQSLATPSVLNPSGNEALGMANWGGFMPTGEQASYLNNPQGGSTGIGASTSGGLGSLGGGVGGIL